ncbi:MAG: MauE/DoxX family redox-associated membrane protein [Jatrophihabitantaceae bacterium]
MIGLLTAAALLLGGAGLTKLFGSAGIRSALTAARLPGLQQLDGKLLSRLSAAVEVAVAIAAIAIGGRFGAGLLAVSYLVLAGLSTRLMSVARGSDCGCFGRPSTISHWHTAVNAGYALIGIAGLALGDEPRRLTVELADRPGVGVMLLLGAVVLGYLSYLLMTALPELLRVTVRLEARG